jgi:outer membrane lipoprotein SlyB
MQSSLRVLSLASALGVAVSLTACGTPDPYGPNNYPVSSANTTYPYNTYPSGTYPSGTYQTAPVAVVEYGRITNVQLLRPGTTASNNNGTAGTLIGGAVGGLLGNQIGHGSGRAAATVLGAIGGAVVGNNVARNNAPAYNTAGPVYRVTVQVDSGAMRTYDVAATGDLRPGDRVRIENGVIYLA